MDYASHNNPKKIRNLKTFGIVGGLVLVGSGATVLALNSDNISQSDIIACYILGGVGIAGGITCASLCLVKAHNMQKEMDLVGSNRILQKSLKLNNGTTLTPSVDYVSDQVHHTQTIGLGLRYNF